MYGSKIAMLRNSRGLTQQSFSKMLGIEQSTLSDIENDKKVKVDDKFLSLIAKELGVSLEDIKSPTPIVMNFTSHDISTAVGQQYNIDAKVQDMLFIQLSTKDAQIDKLLKLLDKE